MIETKDINNDYYSDMIILQSMLFFRSGLRPPANADTGVNFQR